MTPPAPSRGRRRFSLWPPLVALLVASAVAGPAAPDGPARRYTIAFANLTEEPGSEDEALTNLATDEPGPLERHPGLFRQVRERDGIPSLLRVGRPQRGDGRSEEDRDEPGPERIPPAPS